MDDGRVGDRMSGDDHTGRRDADGSNARAEPTGERWIDGPRPLRAELPDDLRSALGRFLGREPVDTLAELVAEMRRRFGDGSIETGDLCLVDEATPHRGVVDGERYHFACFYDAVVLAALTDRPVDVRTESPEGAVVEARAVGTDELSVTPEGAVFSFGIDETVPPPSDEGPTLETGYSAICPYVKAFPDAEAYERWAESVPAATVAMPLSGATELAAELAT